MKTGVYLINFNYKLFLPWALRSLKAQTKKPDVLIFIDDCSTDGSVDLVHNHFSEIKFDEIIINPTNYGAVKSMNLAVEILGEKYKCDYICGLSADDVFDDDYLKKTYNALKKSPKEVGWVYTHVRRIGDENSNDIHPEWNETLHERTPFCHGSSLIKYSAWKQAGGLPDVPREEDWQMFKNMAKLGWKGKLLPELLLRWRKHNLGCRTNMDDIRRK